MKNSAVIVIMGVSGCGKTTIGKLLSQKYGIPFYDADDFHPKANIEKMEKGIPLNTSDRIPWLEVLANKIEEWKNTDGAIMACSALKEKYRTILVSKYNTIIWVVLLGSHDLIQDRIKKRHGHFMKSDLLNSQFNDLEIPEYGIHIDISQPIEKITKEIILKLNLHD